MRIIAGKYKGRVLRTVDDLSVRPATSRVREAVFNVLQHRIDWSSALILDLFAGSGSLGIEALSRGARHVVFVELANDALKHLRSNLALVGCGKEAEVYGGDVYTFLDSNRRLFDVVFASPPYAQSTLATLPEALFRRTLIADNGYVFIEHPSSIQYSAGENWEVLSTRKYGRTLVSIFKARHAAIHQTLSEKEVLPP
jgi:16S rRNA (guanine966-N2)-methyltransferase